MRLVILVHATALLFAQLALANVRSVSPKPDEILDIRLALGIATIVQTPAAVQSAIIGDQSGFRVEYLDRAVTIKPLRPGARTNLYLMTEGRRFNLRLLTRAQEGADFVVYLKPPNPQTKIRWTPTSLKKAEKSVTLVIPRIGVTPEGFLLLECRLSAGRRFAMKPADVWVFQRSASVTIQHLYLSDVVGNDERPIQIGIALSLSDLQKKAPLMLEIRGEETIKITLAELPGWK